VTEPSIERQLVVTAWVFGLGNPRPVKPCINIITLAVADLKRALRFYRDGLGLHSPGIKGEEFIGDEQQAAGAVAMFELADGVILALYPRAELSKDPRSPWGPLKRASSASDNSSRVQRTWTRFSNRRSPLARPSRTLLTNVHGGSTLAIFATPTVTFGKLFTTLRAVCIVLRHVA
jgi:hypothetical protein